MCSSPRKVHMLIEAIDIDVPGDPDQLCARLFAAKEKRLSQFYAAAWGPSGLPDVSGILWGLSPSNYTQSFVRIPPKYRTAHANTSRRFYKCGTHDKQVQ